MIPSFKEFINESSSLCLMLSNCTLNESSKSLGIIPVCKEFEKSLNDARVAFSELSQLNIYHHSDIARLMASEIKKPEDIIVFFNSLMMVLSITHRFIKSREVTDNPISRMIQLNEYRKLEGFNIYVDALNDLIDKFNKIIHMVGKDCIDMSLTTPAHIAFLSGSIKFTKIDLTQYDILELTEATLATHE